MTSLFELHSVDFFSLFERNNSCVNAVYATVGSIAVNAVVLILSKATIGSISANTVATDIVNSYN